MTKSEIADVLEEIAVLLELQGENPFKVRAYRGGARALADLGEEELAARIEAGTLREIRGIGEALAEKIGELHTTGRSEFHQKLKAAVDPGLVEMLEIPGVGPKKIRALHDRLGLASVAALAEACAAGQVAGLPGFGPKTQEKILAGIRNREDYGRRRLWWDAWQVAEPILLGLRARPEVTRAEAAGSLRRGLETVGDLDFLASASEPGPVMDWFASRPGIKEVTARGPTKTSVRFGDGMQADLRLVPDAQFVFALHHFTGSKEHNVQMRQRALARGLSLSEWGLAPAEGRPTGKEGRPGRGPRPGWAAPRTEADLFGLFGLRYIPPELREGLGEIEAAERGELPRLIELADLRGAFHNHTAASDGHATLEEMAAAAEALGWEYLGIADHSKSSFQANGLSEERLLAQAAEIRAFNAAGRCRTHLFAGVECDILPDGRLDYDNSVLDQLDYVVVSVHSALTQDEAAMTARLVRAVEHPSATILGHATGRLLLRREGYRVDVARVVDAALAHGVFIELNANPKRLDLDWRHWRRITAAGRGGTPICAINPDAHRPSDLAFLRAGINSARKGWLTPEEVLNTRSLEEVKKLLKKRVPKF